MEDLLSTVIGTALILIPNVLVAYVAFVSKMEQ